MYVRGSGVILDALKDTGNPAIRVRTASDTILELGLFAELTIVKTNTRAFTLRI